MREDRRRLMKGAVGEPNLPYDAEVEYIATDGGPYIALDWTLTLGRDAYLIDFQATTARTQARLVARNIAGSAGQIYINGTGYFGYRRGSSWGDAGPTYTVGTDRHTWKADWDNYEHVIDGVTYSMGTTFTGSSTSMLLVGPYRGENRFIGRVYAFQLWRDGTLMIDMIPVRVGTEGCMYDRVRKALFHNAGTGSFTYGNDLV